MRLSVLFVIVFTLAYPTAAYADGKFFSSEKVPPDLPYQRALIAHDGGRELLILQSKFEGEAKDFGWVVPLPSVPELASMEPQEGWQLFRRLDWLSTPSVTRISLILTALLFLLCFCVIVCLAVVGFRRKLRGEERPEFLGAGLPAWLLISLLLLIMAGIATPSMMASRDAGGIRILKSEKVGVYDVKVVAAESSEEIITWLNECGYRYDDPDKETFDNYIAKGWCFVTVRVNSEKENEEWSGRWSELVNPLVMYFDSEEIVYPLALTATIGEETEILLYIAAAHKVKDGTERFEVRFAAEREIGNLLREAEFDPLQFSERLDFEPAYLTKLKAKLKPEQMRDDLVLDRAPDDEPYRDHVYRW
jgi:hypothetical protein